MTEGRDQAGLQKIAIITGAGTDRQIGCARIDAGEYAGVLAADETTSWGDRR
jgi:hypothetical protein